MKREELDQIPAGTELLRSVRHTSHEDVAELTTEELTNAVRWLRAASYSASEGARRLEAIIRKRTEQDPTCTSDPTPTAPSTTTGEPPTATPPPPAPRSPSSRKRTAPE